MTSSDHCRTSCACRTEPGCVPSTPSGWSRTSHPWQYGQCSRSRPHRSRTPGMSGSSSLTPVATRMRRAVSARPPARRTAKPGSIADDLILDELDAVAGRPRPGRRRAARPAASRRGTGTPACGRRERCVALRHRSRRPGVAPGRAPARRSGRRLRHRRSPRHTICVVHVRSPPDASVRRDPSDRDNFRCCFRESVR